MVQTSSVAVTETHLPGEGEKLLDVNKGYRLIFSGRTDGRKAEGVGLAFSPYAWNTYVAMKQYLPGY